MTTYQTPIVAGVFQEETRAKQAVDQLDNRGFTREQIGVAQQGRTNATDNLRGDLLNLGVSEERASYYDREYQAGHIVVSVRPDGRETEVETILHNNGAYDMNASNNATAQPSAYSQAEQRPDTEQPGTYPPGPQQADNYGQKDYRQEGSYRQESAH